MADQNMSANIARLYEAKLVDPANLTADDVALIGQFSQREIDMMIQIAQKAYGSDVEMIKVSGGRSGTVKICLPL